MRKYRMASKMHVPLSVGQAFDQQSCPHYIIHFKLFMELTLTTPALLFPALSLLLLAYTNRFLTIAGLIRNLHKERDVAGEDRIRRQIENLNRRITLIRDMQLWGISSLFFCVASMFALFFRWIDAGEGLFAISLVCMMVSLGISIVEIRISVRALHIELESNR